MACDPSSAGPADIAAIATEVFDAQNEVRQIASFTGRQAGLTLDQAYGVTALLERARRARGETAVGRKIGFTNRTIWPEYGVYAPIWGYVTDRSVHELSATGMLSLGGFAEPRIEPEIVFGLGAAPTPDMDETALSACIDWIAHGFEIVQSQFPGWKFAAADTVATNGLHGALVIGPRHAFKPRAAEWRRELATFEIELVRDGNLEDRGRAANVLGSPLSALRHLVGLLQADRINPPLAAAEMISTGTLTRALPVSPGEIWRTRLSGIHLDGIALRLA